MISPKASRFGGQGKARKRPAITAIGGHLYKAREAA
jgi:hypothetical protein